MYLPVHLLLDRPFHAARVPAHPESGAATQAASTARLLAGTSLPAAVRDIVCCPPRPWISADAPASTATSSARKLAYMLRSPDASQQCVASLRPRRASAPGILRRSS